MSIPDWVKNLTGTLLYSKNSDGSLRKSSDGCDMGLTAIEFKGEYLSTEYLTLSATSQALASIPATATKAYIQIQGGTKTDLAYISLDGSAVTTSDMVIRNIEDVGCSNSGLDVGNYLSDIRLLGTANASTAVIVYST